MGCMLMDFEVHLVVIVIMRILLAVTFPAEQRRHDTKCP